MAMMNNIAVQTETILWHIVEALVSAIDERNQTNGHSIRVASYALSIAKYIHTDWESQAFTQLYIGALLHDIGQIYWPDELLKKQGASLTKEERTLIESHTYKGGDLISRWPMLHFVKPYILYHQEWVDGSGYPFGLKGNAIPQEVQIVSLADVYEALVHPRKYQQRPGYTASDAISIMQTMRGKRWEDRLFDLFLQAHPLEQERTFLQIDE